MKFDTISNTQDAPFMITWDLGRRCNYDCTYCAPIHHDNFSPHASLDELISSAKFIFDYIILIAQYRKNKDFNISLTGGEPSNNPNFIKLATYLKQRSDQLKDTLNLRFDLTTNGTLGPKFALAVADTFNSATISYHAEADPKLKQGVLDRIEELRHKIYVKVNVMFHAQYFDECVDLCNKFKANGTNFIPRMIGENPGGEKTFGHRYTDEQLAWINNFWGIKEKPASKIEKFLGKIIPINAFGASIGRPCCGGRSMCVSNDTEKEEVKFLTYRKFKNWHCSVNWYFLHIEQQTDSVYHHQTCQAKFDKTTGTIGKISEGDDIIANLKSNLENNTMPIIVCPNTFCSCGMCTPKSSDKTKLLDSLSTMVDTRVFG